MRTKGHGKETGPPVQWIRTGRGITDGATGAITPPPGHLTEKKEAVFSFPFLAPVRACRKFPEGRVDEGPHTPVWQRRTGS